MLEFKQAYEEQWIIQRLGYQTPAEAFTLIPMEATNEGMVESPILDTLRTTGHDLNKARVLY